MSAPLLVPARHFVLPMSEGWSASDVDLSELVDDDFIENDPDSVRVSADEPLTLPPTHGLTSSAALTFDQLVFIARRVGVEVVLAPSSHRGTIGLMGTLLGCVRHHTGTPNTFMPDADYPDYNVVKEGRPGLWNSLSAFGLGRHRAIYVFSEDVSWHAGEWLWNGITDGNGHFLGIEAAGIGDWTTFQRNIYPRLCASILDFIRQDIMWMPLHLQGAQPLGRKSDAANIWSTFDDEVAHYLANPEQIDVRWTPTPTQEDDMAASRLIRNPKGTVVELSPTYAEWVPTSADHRAAIAQLGPSQTYSDDFFNRLVTRARAAGAASTVSAMRSLARHHSDAVFTGHDGVDPEDPATWPPTPTDDSDASGKA